MAADDLAAYLLAHDRPEGATVDELSAALGMSPATVHQYLYRATRRGLLTKRSASWRIAPTQIEGDHDGS